MPPWHRQVLELKDLRIFCGGYNPSSGSPAQKPVCAPVLGSAALPCFLHSLAEMVDLQYLCA